MKTFVDLQIWITKELPGDDGWYKCDGCDIYTANARLLYELDIDLETIKNILTDLFFAAASEFGN